MSTEEENIEALSRAVMTEARSEADTTLVEARQKADEIRSEAQKQAEAERQRILDNANQEAGRIRSQAIASAHLKARTLQLEQRELLLNNVFEQVLKRFAEIEQKADFANTVRSLLKEALGHLDSKEARVRADARTQTLLTPDVLSAISKETGVKLGLGEPLNQGTGVVVQTVDGHRQFDNTLENRLTRMQDELRNPVNRLLMGEKL